ncbi:Odorant receptor 30 [Blattella germanica]|nr:Odorant receptor 30 [Blattella germanica]
MEESTTQLSPRFEKKMDLLTFIVKFCHFAFVGPADYIAETPWKRRCYRLVQLTLIGSYIPAFIGIVLGLYTFWGDIEVITNILVTGCPLFTGAFIGVYCFIYWDEFKLFIDSIESKSCFSHYFVHSKKNLLEIIEDTKLKGKLLTKFVATVEFIGLASFFFKPFLLEYLEGSNINLTEEEQIMEQWKKMIFIIWLPTDPRQPQIFYSVYVCQFISCLAFYSHTATIITFIFVSTRYVASQFTIVTEALKEVDVLTSIPNYRTETDTKLLGNKFETEQKNQMESRTYLEDFTESYVNENILEDEENNSKEVHDYIRECIKIHQSSIRFAMQLNQLLSPIISFLLVDLTIVIVTAMFQLAVGDGIQNDFPYLGVAIVALTDLFGLCWHGQELINESQAVEFTAYNIHWYNHSSNVKYLVRFIILRAQKAVEIKGSGFINLSINTYSAVLNFCYQWFTLLLKLHDD